MYALGSNPSIFCITHKRKTAVPTCFSLPVLIISLLTSHGCIQGRAGNSLYDRMLTLFSSSLNSITLSSSALPHSLFLCPFLPPPPSLFLFLSVTRSSVVPNNEDSSDLPQRQILLLNRVCSISFVFCSELSCPLPCYLFHRAVHRPNQRLRRAASQDERAE